MKTMCVSSQCSLRRVVQERRSFGVAKMVASISMRGKDVKTNGLKNRMMGMRGQNMRIQAAAEVAGTDAAAQEFPIYETMVVLRPDLSDEQRDSELAKFEAFLKSNGAQNIHVTVRGRQRLAYPIKRFADGIYVLYTYASDPNMVSSIQKMLSTPTAGAELNVLRHMTFRI